MKGEIMTTKPDKTHPETIAGITECQQTADLLHKTIRRVHEKACYRSPLASVILIEILVDACEVERRLSQLLCVAKEK